MAQVTRAPPSGTVTFLFTDIEGSTRLWERHPAEMDGALERHDEILRGAIESNRGYLFATGGDGFAAAFDRAADATRCAVAAQAALDQGVGDGTVRLTVRMGLHTGVASERDGDYFGPAVNRAARVMQTAVGGQIVVSASVHSLLDPAEFPTVDAGEHRLEGLTVRERLHVIDRGETSQLLGIARRPLALGNLPSPRSLFIGRARELEATAQLVNERQIVTLTGIGGAGKTRMAVEVAKTLRERFTDGVWFVDLAEVSDPDDTVTAAASSLDIVLAPGELPHVSLTNALVGRHALIVLDNCEHVLDEAADIVDAVTAGAAHVHFLVTSREGLAVDGEVIRAVAPMGSAAGEDGFDLFVSRVQDVQPGFSPEGTAGEVISELCRRLDGIPLAIELAAARTRTMAIADVLAGLDDRFGLLTRTRRRGTRRHQTMLEAIAWSYELLDDEEAAMLRALATLIGSFDLAAAHSVANSGSSGTRALESLAEKSLVRVERALTPTRYRLLETVRDFAAAQLRACGETESVERRHQRHFVDEVARIGSLLAGPRYLDAIAQLRLARPNLANAMNLAVHESDPESAVALCAPLGFISGIALERADSAVALAAASVPGVAQHEDGDRVLAAALLGAYQRGALDRIPALLDSASQWTTHTGRASPELSCAMCFTTWWDSLDQAVDHGRTAARAARDASDPIMLAAALAYTSLAYWLHDQLDAAIPLATEAVEIAERIPSPILELVTTFAAANAHSLDGDADAVNRYVECLELADFLGHQPISGNCLMQLSLLTPDEDSAVAIRLAAGAIRRHDRMMATELGIGLVVLARGLKLAGRPEEGAVLVAGARHRLPAYFSLPWAVNHVLPVEAELKAELGTRYDELARVGEALELRALIDRSQRVAEEAVPQR